MSHKTPQTPRTFWLTFPEDTHLPFGIGITAHSESDALALLRAEGIHSWIASAKTVHITPGVRAEDLDPRHVLPNAGPLQFRGVWYPCRNISFGAPESPGAPGALGGGLSRNLARGRAEESRTACCQK